MISRWPEKRPCRLKQLTSNNVIMLKMVVMIEKSKICEIHNISSFSFGTIHHIIHTESAIRCRMPDILQKCLRASKQREGCLYHDVVTTLGQFYCCKPRYAYDFKNAQFSYDFIKILCTC